MRQTISHTIQQRAGKVLLRLGCLLLLVACSKKKDDSNTGGGNVVPPLEAQVTIQAATTHQVIRGFGCASASDFPPGTAAYTTQEFDRLFGQGPGQVGLNIFRIRLATDETWRGIELNYAKWAIQRGAIVIASPWTPPANMKTNNNLVGGSLKTDSSAGYARYLNDFANFMSANGAPVYAISVQNEPDIRVSYESCDWTAEEMTAFLKNHGQLVTSTRLMAPESFQNNQAYVNTILADAGAVANIDMLCGHIYGSGITENTVAKTKNLEVWMTEHLDTNITYNANIGTAVEIHDCLTRANFNAYIWWYGKRFYGPLGQDGSVTKRGYLISQFARFIRPGSVRLGTGANSRPEVLLSAYRNGSKKIIVAINTGGTDVKQTITVQDAALGAVLPYTSTGNKDVEQGAMITAAGNSFTVTLPAMSVCTMVEQ